jgi:hypothetical protein
LRGTGGSRLSGKRIGEAGSSVDLYLRRDSQ